MIVQRIGSGAFVGFSMERARVHLQNKCSYHNLSNIFEETTIPQHSVKRPSLFKSLFSSN